MLWVDIPQSPQHVGRRTGGHTAHSPASSAASRAEAGAGLEGLWLGVMVGQGSGPPAGNPLL